MLVLLVHGLRQTADSLLRTGDLPYAAGQQEEEERDSASRTKRLRYFMRDMYTRN